MAHWALTCVVVRLNGSHVWHWWARVIGLALDLLLLERTALVCPWWCSCSLVDKVEYVLAALSGSTLLRVLRDLFCLA